MQFSPYGAGEPVSVQARLSAYLRQEATWRDEEAVEDPDDPRHERAAEALRSLADHVDGLPEDDPEVRALEASQERYKLGLFTPGDEGERLINEFGFTRPVDDYHSILRELVEAEAGEAVNQREGRL